MLGANAMATLRHYCFRFPHPQHLFDTHQLGLYGKQFFVFHTRNQHPKTKDSSHLILLKCQLNKATNSQNNGWDVIANCRLLGASLSFGVQHCIITCFIDERLCGLKMTPRAWGCFCHYFVNVR